MQLTHVRRPVPSFRLLFLAAVLLLVASASHAQLRLDITQGVRDAVPIAVVPFGGQAEGADTGTLATLRIVVAPVHDGTHQVSTTFNNIE